MNFIGQGKLIGYKTYEKDGKPKHIYYVLVAENGKNTDLFEHCEIVTIISDNQVLKDLKVQKVTFEVTSNNFGGKITQRYSNIVTMM